jgi:hypothetical protein
MTNRKPPPPPNRGKPKGSQLGVYLPGFTAKQTAAVRIKLQAIALYFGLKNVAGATANEGSVGKLLVEITEGKLEVGRPDTEDTSLK